MATFYLDFEGGNDSNDGTTFANRWKTITSGATAARIAPGDVIRIMASPSATSLGQSATWTDNSGTVTLTSAVTANVTTCDSAWTPSTNVTATASTSTKREGTASAQLTIASGFTTGLAAYFATGTLDLSAYQQLSFWYMSSGNTAASVFRIDLCSDAAGTTPVNSFTINFASNAGTWHNLTFDNGSALGSSIQSVALTVLIDQGNVTVNLDNILACKAASSADSLTLRSLIGKNTGGEPEWWPILSINGTSVILNGASQGGDNANSLKYHGTTESVTTYKQETTSLVSILGQTTQDSGNGSSGFIEYSGGWDRTDMSTQTGVTILGGKYASTGITLPSSSAFLKFTKLYTAFWATGLSSPTQASHIWVQDFAFSGGDTGVDWASVVNSGIDDYKWSFGLNRCIRYVGACRNIRVKGTKFAVASAVTGPPIVVGGGIDCRFEIANIYGGTTSFSIDERGSADFANTVCSRYNTAAANLINDTAKVRLFNCNLGATPYTGTAYSISIKDGQAADTHKITLPTSGGTITSATDQRHTASDFSWKFAITSTTSVSSIAPAVLPLGKVAVAASSLVTIKLWCRRSNTGLTLGLMIPRGQIAGVSSDVLSPMTAAADTWEEVEATFTPTEAGVVELFAFAYGGTTYSGWVDDLTITQA